MTTPSITIARGDGIGPEIMDATLSILEKGGANLHLDEIVIGEQVYKQGITTGIPDEAWDTLRKNSILLKAPITTPQGGGVKSLNVTIRKTLGLYANVRPCVSYHPFIPTHHPKMDVVIVRENEEDLYAGIEHRQTRQVTQCLKLISTPGSEKICRYAFEFAKIRGRKKVTCVSKDNIMKMTDGLFHSVFNKVATEYPEIATNHIIVDIGMARLANKPDIFDVIVLPNLYGDIISDIAAEITGSVGLAPSVNIGDHFSMFEAIHGSAPDIAGQNIANPSGLLLAACQMLAHMGQTACAETIHNAWLKTIESGHHTADIYSEKSTKKVSTTEFTQAVISNLGSTPSQLTPAAYPSQDTPKGIYTFESQEKKELVGTDIFIDYAGTSDALAAKIKTVQTANLTCNVITNRGVKVWPDGFEDTYCSDHWRCRFQSKTAVSHADILDIYSQCTQTGLDVIKTENLYTFDGLLLHY